VKCPHCHQEISETLIIVEGGRAMARRNQKAHQLTRAERSRGGKKSQAKRKAQNPSHLSAPPEQRFLSRRDLAERWGVGVWTIIAREREGIITPYRFNALNLRYRESDIKALEEVAVKFPQNKPASPYLRRHQLLAAKKVLSQDNHSSV